jgi:DNA-binding NtrC family response regulator
MSSPLRILLIDDLITQAVVDRILADGFNLTTCSNSDRLESILEDDECPFDLALVDFTLKGTAGFRSAHHDGVEVTRALSEWCPELSIVGISKYLASNSELLNSEVSRWIIAGAAWWVNTDRLGTPNGWAEYAPSLKALAERTRTRRARLAPRFTESAPALPKTVLDMAVKAARAGSTVLIRGETGVGKEVLAKFIADQAAAEPFVSVNCAAIPPTLFESEMFGTEKGGYTGAVSRDGIFEKAHNGVLFLDEVGELDLPCQAKLLRVIQEGKVTRVGGVVELDARPRVLICATNQPLEELVASKKFRRDLFFRLNVIPIVLPPLRERLDELPTLVKTLLARCNNDFEREVGFESEKAAVEFFGDYFRKQPPNTSGNVRELELLLRRVVCMANSDIVRTDDIEKLCLTPARIQVHASDRPLLKNMDAFYARFVEKVEPLIKRLGDPKDHEVKNKAALIRIATEQVLDEYTLDGFEPVRAKRLEGLLEERNPELWEQIRDANPRRKKSGGKTDEG